MFEDMVDKKNAYKYFHTVFLNCTVDAKLFMNNNLEI